MVPFRVRWSPVSSCSRMQVMWTSRTLRAERRCTTPPCWDTQGESFTSSLLLQQTYTQRILGHFEEWDATRIICELKTMTNLSLCCRQVCLFLKRGANQNAADIDEKTPLTIAVEAANADIVTLWVLFWLSIWLLSILTVFVLICSYSWRDVWAFTLWTHPHHQHSNMSPLGFWCLA